VFDYGGQRLFQWMQHLLLSPFAIYFVVFDLTKFKTLESENENEKNFEFINQSMDYIIHWLKQISIFAKEASIFLIGTHADLIEDVNNLYLKINTFLSSTIEKDFEIKNILNNLIKNEDLIYFPVDNKKRKTYYVAGYYDADGLNIKNLKEKATIEVKNNSLNKIKKKIPTSCFTLYEIIGQQNLKYIDINDKVAFENLKEDCDEPLFLEKHLENLVYLGFVLKFDNFFVFDVMWLINKFSCLVRDFYLHPNFEIDVELMKNKKFSFDWRMLTQHGLLSDDILDVFWKKKTEYKNNEEYEKDKNVLLKIMSVDSDVIVEIKNIVNNKKYYFLPFVSIAATSLEKSFSNFDYSKTIEEYTNEQNCFVLKCSKTFPEDFFFRFIVAIEKQKHEIFYIDNNKSFNYFNISTSLLDFLPSNHCNFFPCINRSINGNIVSYLKFKNFLLIIPHGKILKKIVIFNVGNDDDIIIDETEKEIQNIVDVLIEKYYKNTFTTQVIYIQKKNTCVFETKNVQFSNNIDIFFENNNVDFFNEVFEDYILMWNACKFFLYSNVLDVFYEIIKNFLYDEVDLSLLSNNNQHQLANFQKKLSYHTNQNLILEYNLLYYFDKEKYEEKFGDVQEWRKKKNKLETIKK
jgi:hypothetical protein